MATKLHKLLIFLVTVVFLLFMVYRNIHSQNRVYNYTYIYIYFFFLFCTMTNKCTINSQIITLLHVSTLLFHPQGACN